MVSLHSMDSASASGALGRGFESPESAFVVGANLRFTRWLNECRWKYIQIITNM